MSIKQLSFKKMIPAALAACVLTAVVLLAALSRPNHNDSYPKNQTDRDNKYELNLQPSNPKKGDEIHYSFYVRDRVTGRPVADSKFIIIVDKLPDKDRFIQLDTP